MTNCYDCHHCEVCRWIDKFKDKGVCDFYEGDTPLNDVLDKIRDEIQENIDYNKKMNYQGIVAGLLLTLATIDKYTKGEDE